MNRSMRFQVLLLLLMVSAASIAFLAKPTRFMAALTPRPKLSDEVPDVLQHWKKLPIEPVAVVDPTQQAVLKYLYTETLSATYANDAKQFVMLSIAYGEDQSDGHDVHKPDLCYPAQGFTVMEQREIPITLDKNRTILAKYMKTQKGQRIEPLMYWTTSGDFIYKNKLQRKIINFKYSTANLIPDGLVVRVSMIENNQLLAIDTLSKFVQNWYASLPMKERNRYFGSVDQ